MESAPPEGIIVIDKPCGHTSHEITSFVKKILCASRTGHAGTLDPQVSGVLPVAIGRATKLLQYVASKDKTYVGIIKFRNVQPREKIESLFREFTGTITQTPPKISAVRKVPRKREIFSLRLIEISEANPRLALFEAKVGAGTYIRTLCEDIGKKCGGARMEELRRTSVGKIGEGQCHTMQDLVDAAWLLKAKGDDSLVRKLIQPAEKFIGLPKAFLKESALKSVFSGAQVMAPAVERLEMGVKAGARVSMWCGERFIGVGIAQMGEKELAHKKHGLAIRLERVHRPL